MDIAVASTSARTSAGMVGLDASCAVVTRRKVRRETLIALAEKFPPCIVGMEACCCAHHLARVFAGQGCSSLTRAQWAELDRRISAFDAEFVPWVKENEEARQVTTIRGAGSHSRVAKKLSHIALS